MAKVSIAQAAKMVGISRTTMYRKFINLGNISVEADADWVKQIDTSELMRDFPFFLPTSLKRHFSTETPRCMK